MERDEMKRLSMAALQYAANGEPEAASAIVAVLASTGDPRNLYGACCGWAGSAEVALERIHGPLPDGGMWTFGDIAPLDMDHGPEQTFACRFIAAYSNGDMATTEALFAVAYGAGPKQGAGSLGALLSLAARLNAEVAR